MEKNVEEHCLKYIEHYSKWLPSDHHYICDIEVALTQMIGAGDATALQKITDKSLTLKIQLCQKLLKIYSVLAAG